MSESSTNVKSSKFLLEDEFKKKELFFKQKEKNLNFSLYMYFITNNEIIFGTNKP